jgi:hypothetical protein
MATRIKAPTLQEVNMTNKKSELTQGVKRDIDTARCLSVYLIAEEGEVIRYETKKPVDLGGRGIHRTVGFDGLERQHFTATLPDGARYAWNGANSSSQPRSRNA